MLQGYYSLIQYCPDWKRLDVCNIGVMLLCPEAQYLDAMMVQSDTRVRTIFGNKHLQYVQAFKDRFAERIRNERESIMHIEGLNTFIAQRANYFRVTEPRSIAVEDNPVRALENLYRDIFAETEKPPRQRAPNITALLFKMLKEYGIEENRIIRKLPKVPVPGYSETITPCLGFLNGRFNLVVPCHLTPKTSFAKISHNLFAGKILFEQSNVIWGEQKLVVLASPDDDNVKAEIEASRPAFKEHQVALLTSVEDAARYIKDEATREIPEKYRLPA